jgi:hypothetical protein
MSSKRRQEQEGPQDPPLDIFDLSYVTPLLTASTLEERPNVPFQIGGILKSAVGLTQRAGHFARRISFEKFFKPLMYDFETVQRYPGAMVASWFASRYEKRPYHNIILGPPLGSMAYLSCVLDAPFLPLNYRMCINHPKPMNADNIADYARRAREIGDIVTRKDPFVELVSEYDPVHERLRVRNASLMRYKFLQLPRAYEQFIRSRLAPGGSVILVESRTGWNQYTLDDRLSMQVGLTGGIPDEEFLRGSKRLAAFRERYLGDDKAAWRLNMRTEVKPESQFGVSPMMRASIVNSCAQLKKPVLQLFSNDIFQVNNLVSSLFVRCARREGKRPTRFFVHSGLFIAPYEAMQSLLLPLWVPDSSSASLAYAKEYINAYSFETDTAFVALEPSVAGAPDALPFKDWAAAAGQGGRKVRVVANTPRLFPFDITAYFNFWRYMQIESRRIRDPLEIRVNLDMLIEEAQNCQLYYNMHMPPGAPAQP